MGMDYDLVILGSNQWSQKLAITANAHGARTAWLTFPELISPLSLSSYLHDRPIAWEEIERMGVDVIRNGGNFIKKQTLQVGHRKITGRHFVVCGRPISPSWNPRIYDCWRWSDFWQNLSSLENYQSLAIAGADIYACMVAQWLNKRGKEVHLFFAGDRILSEIDREVGGFLQATMEAKGIIIYPNHRVTAVKGRKIWAGRDIFQTDITVAPRFAELVDLLNLVFVPSARLHYLQSSRDIYGILRKVLFGSIFNPKGIFHQVSTDPPLVQWQSDMLKSSQTRTLITRSLWNGFTKVITDRRGKILAFSAIGKEVDLLLDTLPYQYLPRLSALHPLISDLQEQFHQHKSPHPWLQFALNVSRDFDL